MQALSDKIRKPALQQAEPHVQKMATLQPLVWKDALTTPRRMATPVTVTTLQQRTSPRPQRVYPLLDGLDGANQISYYIQPTRLYACGCTEKATVTLQAARHDQRQYIVPY